MNPLEPDVFVAMNRFKVLPGKEEAFEKRWAARESSLEDMDGFLTFVMLRRDALNAEDGYNYSTLTVWRDPRGVRRVASLERELEGARERGRGEGDALGGTTVSGDVRGCLSASFREGRVSVRAVDATPPPLLRVVKKKHANPRVLAAPLPRIFPFCFKTKTLPRSWRKDAVSARRRHSHARADTRGAR